MSSEQPTTASPSGLNISITRASFEDARELVVVERSSFTHGRLSQYFGPNRKKLWEAGIPVDQWPGFQLEVRRREHLLLGPYIVYVARVQSVDSVNGNEKGKAVGFAIVEPKKWTRSDWTWSDWFWWKLVFPVQDRLSALVYGPDFKESDFGSVFHAETDSARQILHGNDPYVLLKILCVHPQYRGHGVGTSLLNRVFQLADESRMLLTLESTDEALGLYKRVGFKVVHECSVTYNGDKISWPIMNREVNGP